METIYLIRAISGDYDIDNWIVGWVETPEKAVETCKHMNEIHELAVKYKTLIRDFHSSVVKTTPQEEMETIPQYPRWPAGIPQNLITKEMRDERERIKKEASEVQERNEVKWKRYYEIIDKLVQEYKDSLNLHKEVLDEIETDYVRSYDWYELKKL